jgi:hypothetical protein
MVAFRSGIEALTKRHLRQFRESVSEQISEGDEGDFVPASALRGASGARSAVECGSLLPL